MKFVSKNLKQTEEIAKSFLEKIALEFSDGAIVVGLYGDLGSGKTTFTQSIAKYLGIDENVTSPTFVIQKRYQIPNTEYRMSNIGEKKEKDKKNTEIHHSPFNIPYSSFIHIDAYRLDSGKELLALDFERDLNDPKNIIFIEWPERVSEILPKNHAKINFKFISENEREVEI